MKNSVLTTALAGLMGVQVAQIANAETQQYSIEAPVTSVSPIVQTVTDKIAHRSCQDELVRLDRHAGHHSRVPQVMGAVIGGAAAGAIGDNTGHQGVIAVAGALLGAAIGSDASRRHNTRSRYVTEERCTVDYELRDREIITGYRVGYRYDGTIHYTRTTQRPGETIRLNVVVEPDTRG